MSKLYLDIETTGLSKEKHEVTVLGAFDGEEVYQLVKNRDLNGERIQELFRDTEEVVTFNGKRFDIPFLKHNYDIRVDCDHQDLMYKGWKIDWYGGLKKIEKKIGISRDSGVTDGSKAIKLWKDYIENDDTGSLKKLLKYNREDVLNLETVEREMNKRL